MSILTLYINFVVFYSESAAVCMRLLATNNIHFSLLIPSKKEEERVLFHDIYLLLSGPLRFV